MVTKLVPDFLQLFSPATRPILPHEKTTLRFTPLGRARCVTVVKVFAVLLRLLRFTLLCVLYTAALALIVTAIRVSDNVPAGETAINFRYEVF